MQGDEEIHVMIKEELIHDNSNNQKQSCNKDYAVKGPDCLIHSWE